MLTLEFFLSVFTDESFDEETPVTDVVIDSRKVTPGAVFFAMRGEHTDGHDYVQDALERGALAAIVEQDIKTLYPLYDLREGGAIPSSPDLPAVLRVESSVLALQEAARQWVRRFDKVRTIGVTGSVGKSTTKEVIADVLARRYKVLKSEGSYNNELGIPLTVLKLNETHQRMVLEMSMYTLGEIALLTSIAPPTIGVVTLIAPVHLERAGSLENIIRAKAELLEALPAHPKGTAVLNLDDDNVMSMTQYTSARIVTYGLSPHADFWADAIEGLGLSGIQFWIHHGSTHRQLHLPMLGQHSVHTALAAVAVGVIEGLSWEDIVRGLQASRSQLRLLAVKGPNGSIILDDTYNASPSSTIAALNLLNDLIEGRRIAVLGDMLELGSYEEEGHKRVGRRAAAVADLLIAVGQRARIIAREAEWGGMPSDSIQAVDSAEEAAELVLSIAQGGDTILIKGSRAVGMERIVARLAEETRS